MSTYYLISKNILSASASEITFNNIPNEYDDLSLAISCRTNSASALDVLYIKLNNSASSVYSFKTMTRNDTNIATNYSTNVGFIDLGLSAAVNSTASCYANYNVSIPSYKSSNNKTISSDWSAANFFPLEEFLGFNSGTYNDSSAINSITLYPKSLKAFIPSSSFYLYGIKNMDDGAEGYFGPAAQGGDEVFTTGDGYKVHVFKNSGTLNVTTPGEVEYLVVAGGGGGGGTPNNQFAAGGGGGAGGFISGNLNLYTNNYSIIVGAGGSGGVGDSSGLSGSNSIFSNITATGGGFGGHRGNTGGSGGSGGAGGGLGPTTGGLGISGQGNNGGGVTNNNGGGAGGGGAGAVGGSVPSGASGANGGQGKSSSIVGSSVFYSGGGGGGAYNLGTPGTGGSGGGGNGGAESTNGSNGTANLGGGGGSAGGTYNNVGARNGGSGGSGIVIIRYRI